jgi:hypothetical protein
MASQDQRYDNEERDSHRLDRKLPMSENYEITRSASPTVQRVSANLKLASTIGFWVQIVLGVISGVTFLFASTSLLGNRERTQGIEFGIFSAFCGLILLAIAVYFSIRYGRLARQLQNPNATSRPKKSEILQLIKLGLMINLGGMLMAILGAAALAGIVLLKSLTIPQGTLAYNPKQFVNSIDLLTIQANTNAIMAHFGGIVTTLWLLDRITK